MRAFVDECVNRRLMSSLVGHTFVHCAATPLRGMKNGALLRVVAPDYDVFLTRDRNIPFQQNLKRFPLAFVIMCARSNALIHLLPLVPRTLAALDVIDREGFQHGDLHEIFPN